MRLETLSFAIQEVFPYFGSVFEVKKEIPA
jgi:hypothetical protein